MLNTPKHTQLFREMLSNKTVATMWKGIMGNGGSWFLDCVFRCFSNIERNSTNKFRYAFSFFVAKHREPQSSKATLSTNNTDRHCRVLFYAFVGQPLSKQLYRGYYTVARRYEFYVRVIAGFQCHAIQNTSKSKSKPLNRLSSESEKRKKVTMQRLSPRFRSQQFFLC